MSALALALLPLVAASATPADPLETSRDAVKRLEFAQARTALDGAERLDGLTVAQAAEYFELRGLVAGSLGDKAKARQAFFARLLLDPAFRLKGKVSPKVSTPFFEAKAEAEEKGAITLTVEPVLPGRAKIVLGGAWAGLVKQLVITARDAQGERPTRVPAAKEQVVECAAQCQVAVEALGERDWRLVALAAAAVVTMPAPVAAVPTPAASPKGADVVPPPPPPPAVTAPAPQPARGRLTGLVVGLGAAAAAAAVTGGILGASSAAARTQFDQAARDSNGVVTGLTRADALALSERAKGTALGANIAFGLAGALAVGAVAVLIVDLTAAVAPTPGGAVAVVSGRF